MTTEAARLKLQSQIKSPIFEFFAILPCKRKHREALYGKRPFPFIVQWIENDLSSRVNPYRLWGRRVQSLQSHNQGGRPSRILSLSDWMSTKISLTKPLTTTAVMQRFASIERLCSRSFVFVAVHRCRPH